MGVLHHKFWSYFQKLNVIHDNFSKIIHVIYKMTGCQHLIV
jgi:hypothetical protein